MFPDPTLGPLLLSVFGFAEESVLSAAGSNDNPKDFGASSSLGLNPCLLSVSAFVEERASSVTWRTSEKDNLLDSSESASWGIKDLLCRSVFDTGDVGPIPCLESGSSLPLPVSLELGA